MISFWTMVLLAIAAVMAVISLLFGWSTDAAFIVGVVAVLGETMRQSILMLKPEEPPVGYQQQTQDKQQEK